MGVKLQHILGIFLILQICSTTSNSALSESANLEKNDTEANQIEKLTKTNAELNTIEQENTQESVQDSLGPNKPTAPTLTTQSTTSSNADNKENVIAQESSDREDKARSIDIEKFISPEFQNNVFSYPISSDTEKYSDESFHKSTTNKHPSYPKFELTTPKTILFDQKYQEARQKLEQEYEENSHNEDEEHQVFESHEAADDDEEELHLDKIGEDISQEPNSTLDVKEQLNISKDNVIEKNSNQNSFTIEQVKKVRYFSNFNDTSTFKYDSKEDTSTQKPFIHLTEKSVTLTKPTANKNTSYILNNKIESETIKAIPTEATTEKQKHEDKVEPREQLEEENVAITTTEAATTEQETTTAVAFGTTTATEEITTVSEDSVTLEQLLTQPSSNDAQSTAEDTTPMASTTDVAQTTTAEPQETTTVELIETTRSGSGFRVSKGITMEEVQSTEAINTTTEAMDTTIETVSTEQTTLEITTTEALSSTIEASTTEQPELPTTQLPEVTTEAVITEAVTTEAVTTEAVTIEAVTNETVEPTDPLPVTTVEFIHVETRNNHTTLVPDTLSPNLSYPTTNGSSASSGTERSAPDHTTAATDTTEDGSDETAESSASTEGNVMSDPDESRGKIIAIAISSVGAVCLILLAGLLYIMRKRQSRFNYKQRCRPVNLDDYSVDNISVYNSVRRKAGRQSKRSYGNPAFDDPVAVTHPLNYPALAKFAATVEDVRAEFEDIPQIAAKSSELPEGCEPKNRYANVIPLPETRVALRAVEGCANSDYINANFVTGPKNTRGYYIATQAPMENTVDDFWRMIWEHQSKVILMITHLFENGVEKCVDYLPPSEVLDCHRMFGDYQVTLKKRDVKEKYVISSLQLKNMVSNSWREITHFWYIGWPEKGVPSEGNSLIAFLIEARSFMKSATLDKGHITSSTMNGSLPCDVNPVVVHCSPGTGRTGVVIACDIAIREFEQSRLVDIPKIVYRIRRDRASSVQTKEQYIFIYKVVSLYATKLTGGSLDSF